MKTNKLIEFLDGEIDDLKGLDIDTDNPICNDRLSFLTEIKEIVEQQAQGDEELVEKIRLVLGNGIWAEPWEIDKIMEKMRKLLQSRQPGKMTDSELMLEMKSRGLVEFVEQ